MRLHDFLDYWARERPGAEFAFALSKKPSSAFVAEGSAIVVRKGRRIA